MKITRNKDSWIVITGDDGGKISSQSVEANLLYEILQLLKSVLKVEDRA